MRKEAAARFPGAFFTLTLIRTIANPLDKILHLPHAILIAHIPAIQDAVDLILTITHVLSDCGQVRQCVNKLWA